MPRSSRPPSSTSQAPWASTPSAPHSAARPCTLSSRCPTARSDAARLSYGRSPSPSPEGPSAVRIAAALGGRHRRGRRRGQGGLPRRRLHRGEPHRRPPRSGRPRCRRGRPRPRVLPAADPRRRGRRRRARRARPADRSCSPGRLGDASRHLDALPESERAGYQAGAALATRLATAVTATESDSVRHRSEVEVGSHRHGRHRDRRRLSRPPRRGPRHRPHRRPRPDHGRAPPGHISLITRAAQ